MNDIGTGIILAIVGTIIGFFGARFLLNIQRKNKTNELNAQVDLEVKEARLNAKRIIDEAELKAEKLLDQSEVKNERIKQRKIQEAKDNFNSLKSQFESHKATQMIELKEREIEIKALEGNFKQVEERLDTKAKNIEVLKAEIEQKDADLAIIRENLEKQLKIISKKKEELDAANEIRIKELEKISLMTEQEAKDMLLEAVKAKVENESMVIIKDSIERAKLNAGKEAKKIVVQTIQRMCAEYTIENTVSVFNLESDDLKGQIIGREGRNIRALEAATGAEFVVDDTPEAIVISSFDPIRREVARLSLKKLVADGRIHPARIEEVVAKTRKQLDEQIVEIGERTVIELDIHGLDPYLIKQVGRMRFRSSYGQNLLMHSRETANLCGIMAAELGMNPKLAKRAGLLHDIGKVPDEETELSHALLGAKLAEKYGENPAVVNAIGAHHDEMEMQYVISPIIQACDAISGARPGARREIMQQYIQRIKDLENMALAYNGVEKAYAIQAGRELRVIVEADKVSDADSDKLSFEIAQKIQTEMTFPGQIKVTVIREKRAINIAR